MHGALLDHEPDPLVAPGLAGRGAERAQLAAALGRARDGRPGVAVVAGAAGTGKTALVADLAARAAGCRAVWLSGEAFERDIRLGVVDQLFRTAGETLGALARRARGRRWRGDARGACAARARDPR